MSIETVARRYANALADVVLKSGETETVRAELTQWQGVFDGNAELNSVFGNPAITHSDKRKVLDQLISRGKPSQTTANFLRILSDNGRIGELGAINERFAAVLEERSGVVSAAITSARDLPEAERSAFKANLEKLTGKRVEINYEIDQEIIGGVITRIGSTVYDGSVKTRLESLKEQMIGR
jgi:F-type H+-transporting ATPase subunit delta